MSGRRLLITGAAGYTGRHAAVYFAAEGAEVTAVMRGAVPGEAGNRLFPEGVRTYICDLNDGEAVKKMIEDTAPDEVLHLAGRNSVPESWRSPVQYLESNVMAPVYLLDALRSRPSVRILVIGSMLKFKLQAAERPPHPYSLSKTLEELVSLSWGMLFRQQVLVAEPCNLIGPGASTGFCSLLGAHIARSERGEAPEPFRLSSRLARRDFVDVRDAVRAYDFILKRGKEDTVYRIDTGNPRSLGDIADRMLELTQARVPMEWGPEAAQGTAEARGPGEKRESADAPDREARRSPVDLGDSDNPRNRIDQRDPADRKANQPSPDPNPRQQPSGRQVRGERQNPAEYPAGSVTNGLREAEGFAEHASALGWRPQVKLERSLADILDYYRNQEGAMT